jgi:predicted O-methyltransferase YrrM
MSRIGKTIKAIFEVIRNPWLLNNVLSDGSIWSRYLQKKYHLTELPVVDLLELCPGFSEELNNYSFLDGGSLPTDLALLKALCRRFHNCSYFEIGTWRGESVSNVAEMADECYTLNMSSQEMQSNGLGSTYYNQIGFYSRSKKNILHLEGNSRTFNFSALNKSFDLLFIDGDHHYDSVKSDTENIFTSLIHENSIVVWHDCAYTPEKPRLEVIAAILDGIPSQFRRNIYQVSNTLCAVFIREDLPAVKPVKPEIPNKNFTLNIRANKI